jgi:hypothetical protein
MRLAHGDFLSFALSPVKISASIISCDTWYKSACAAISPCCSAHLNATPFTFVLAFIFLTLSIDGSRKTGLLKNDLQRNPVGRWLKNG